MITQTIETITPEMAKEYLETNKSNRSISRQRVRAYADDMRKGQWALNGEAISFDSNGNLLNGQHRLSAIVTAGVPVTMAVVRGVDAVGTVFDIGRVRTSRDVLRLNGTNDLRASTPVVGAYKLLYFVCTGKSVVPSWVYPSCDKTYGEKMERLCLLARKHGTAKGRRVSSRAPVLLAGLYAVSNNVPFETIGQFYLTLNTGFYDTPGEKAAVVLRNDLTTTIRTNLNTQRALFVATERAISDYVQGRERTKSYLSTKEPVWGLATIDKVMSGEEL